MFGRRFCCQGIPPALNLCKIPALLHQRFGLDGVVGFILVIQGTKEKNCCGGVGQELYSGRPIAMEDAVDSNGSGQRDSAAVAEPPEQNGVTEEDVMKGVLRLECPTIFSSPPILTDHEAAPSNGPGSPRICHVFVVGTAHVSQESCEKVQAVIRQLKPQVVFLELCRSRIPILSTQNLKVPTMSEMIDAWKKHKMNIFGILYSFFLAKVSSSLDVLPGSEFRVAYEEAMSYGAKVVLGDRPVEITLRRTWGRMPLFQRAKCMFNFLRQIASIPTPEDLNKMLKEMDDMDMLSMAIRELSKEFPTLTETLVEERDMYMSSTLLNCASSHSSVVAVVGKGHLPGIKKHWMQPIEIKDLLSVPQKKSGASRTTILVSVGVALAGIAFASGFIHIWGKK